jgi:hypothetical protein
VKKCMKQLVKTSVPLIKYYFNVSRILMSYIMIEKRYVIGEKLLHQYSQLLLYYNINSLITDKIIFPLLITMVKNKAIVILIISFI